MLEGEIISYRPFEFNNLLGNRQESMGASTSNCFSLCANSASSRKRELDSDEILDSLGIGNLKEIKRTNMMEDSLADKLAIR